MSFQAIWPDWPRPATTFTHLDATTVLSRGVAECGIYPAVDPLDSTSRIMDPNARSRPWRAEAAPGLQVRRGNHCYPGYVLRRLVFVSLIFDRFLNLFQLLIHAQDKVKVARARKIERFVPVPALPGPTPPLNPLMCTRPVHQNTSLEY